MKTIVLGGGCFWCLEAVYQQTNGVEKVVSGYAGGGINDIPTYENHGNHAEVVQLTYNEDQIALDIILEIFFYIHDPTTFNQQGYDKGTAYRSIILCNDTEIELAENAKAEAQILWDDPIVTEVKVLDKFHKAEDYHQDFYNKNQNVGYCQVIINPKLTKFREKFANNLKV